MSHLVSIIIPTFNRLGVLPQTINSILHQTWQNWECIIIDDGSNDKTMEYLASLKMSDRRFKYFQRPLSSNKGASSCRNIGFQNSMGDYIQYLDSDDLLSPEKIEKQLKSIVDYKGVIASCDWSLFSDNPKINSQKINLPLKNEKYQAFSLLEALGSVNQFLPPHSYLTPRQLVEKAGGWDETLTNNDDAEFFTRVLSKSQGVIHLPETLVYYRRSVGTNLSNYSNRKKVKSAIRSWNLIEKTFTESLGKKESIYIANSKTRLYNATKNKYPLLIKKHHIFFEKQLDRERFRLETLFIFKRVFKNMLRKTVFKLIKI